MIDYISGFGLIDDTTIFYDNEDPRVRDLIRSSLVYFLTRRERRDDWHVPYWTQTIFPRFLGLISTTPAVGQPMITLAVVMPTPHDIAVVSVRHGPGLQAEARHLRQQTPQRLFRDSIPVRNYWFDFGALISPDWSSPNEHLGWFNDAYNTTLSTAARTIQRCHFSPVAVLINAEIEDRSYLVNTDVGQPPVNATVNEDMVSFNQPQ